VLRHSRLRYPSAICQGVNCLFPVTGQALEESPPRWVSKSLENIVRRSLHSKIITIRLLIVKRSVLSLRRYLPQLCFDPAYGRPSMGDCK
jgi:hypothetical protein